jgi:hypothetical protein
MPLTQGAKVFLGAGGLIALYSLARSRRHHAEARAEYQAYAGNPYAPVYPPEPSRATALKEVVKQHGGAAIKDATHAAGEVAEVLITHGKVGRGARLSPDSIVRMLCRVLAGTRPPDVLHL